MAGKNDRKNVTNYLSNCIFKYGGFKFDKVIEVEKTHTHTHMVMWLVSGRLILIDSYLTVSVNNVNQSK